MGDNSSDLSNLDFMYALPEMNVFQFFQLFLEWINKKNKKYIWKYVLFKNMETYENKLTF